ncbi:MAG: helix-turn-helix domain-containing protein [Polyangiaceae bacterium]
MNESFNSFTHHPTKPLTSRQAAASLGVSESSVKRWCDGGVLRTVRTPGGHRRIPVEAVLELSRRDGLEIAEPGKLVGATGGEPASPATARRLLVRALLRDDEGAVRNVLDTQRLASSGLDVVADEVIGPALLELGERWAKGTIEIYEERRACGLLHRYLGALGDRLRQAPASAPLALGGTLEGDPFTLPTAIVEFVLREHGMAARSLGSWLPGNTLARAIHEMRPRLVWLAVGHTGPHFRSDYAKVAEATRAVGAALVVGGRALRSQERRGLRYASFCDGMVQLSAFAEAIR